MPALTEFWLSSPLQISIITGVVLAGCVAGVSIFLSWLDRQVPSLPSSLPVLLAPSDHGYCTSADKIRVDTWAGSCQGHTMYGCHSRVDYAATFLRNFRGGVKMDGLLCRNFTE